MGPPSPTRGRSQDPVLQTGKWGHQTRTTHCPTTRNCWIPVPNPVGVTSELALRSFSVTNSVRSLGGDGCGNSLLNWTTIATFHGAAGKITAEHRSPEHDSAVNSHCNEAKPRRQIGHGPASAASQPGGLWPCLGDISGLEHRRASAQTSSSESCHNTWEERVSC